MCFRVNLIVRKTSFRYAMDDVKESFQSSCTYLGSYRMTFYTRLELLTAIPVGFRFVSPYQNRYGIVKFDVWWRRLLVNVFRWLFSWVEVEEARIGLERTWLMS